MEDGKHSTSSRSASSLPKPVEPSIRKLIKFKANFSRVNGLLNAIDATSPQVPQLGLSKWRNRSFFCFLAFLTASGQLLCSNTMPCAREKCPMNRKLKKNKEKLIFIRCGCLFVDT